MLGRLGVCLLFALTPVLAEQTGDASQTKCVLDGTAVDFASGERVRKATIRLTPSAHSAPGQIAITDASGHFHLENIRDGDYELTGERTGYLKSEFGARQPAGGGTPLRLKAGDTLTGLTLKLAPCPVITGKVTDENGDPVSKALVYAVRRGWMRGELLYFRSDGVWTDDRGEYRMADLSPGRYYLCADGSSEGFVEQQGGQEKRTVWSFYPGARDLDGAQALDLQSSQNVSGINFQLHTEPVFHIRGKLAGKGWNDTDNRLALSVHPHNGNDALEDLEADINSDGSFDVQGAPAGSYDIDLVSQEDHQRLATVSVDVKKADINGIVLSTPNRFNLRGVVRRVEEENVPWSSLWVHARDVNAPASNPYETTIDPDGTFTLENVYAGKYLFEVTQESHGEYVQSIRYGGHDVLGIPVDVTGGSGKIEITISGGAGRIDGSIQSDGSGASVGGLAVVLALEGRREDSDAIQTATTDQNGHFLFNNVAPGRYHAFAVADVDRELLQNRGFVAELQGDGTEVEVPENGNLQIRLPIVSAEEVQRALSVLGL